MMRLAIEDFMEAYKMPLMILGLIVLVMIHNWISNHVSIYLKKKSEKEYDESIKEKKSDRLFARELIQLMIDNENNIEFNTRHIYSMQTNGCDMLGYRTRASLMEELTVFCINGYAFDLWDNNIIVSYKLREHSESCNPDVTMFADKISVHDLSYAERSEINRLMRIAYDKFNPKKIVNDRKKLKDQARLSEMEKLVDQIKAV